MHALHNRTLSLYKRQILQQHPKHEVYQTTHLFVAKEKLSDNYRHNRHNLIIPFLNIGNTCHVLVLVIHGFCSILWTIYTETKEQTISNLYLNTSMMTHHSIRPIYICIINDNILTNIFLFTT